MARPKSIKAENPSYENKADKAASSVTTTQEPKVNVVVNSVVTGNRAKVIKAHDGLTEGMIIITTSSTIDRMVAQGYWERVCE